MLGILSKLRVLHEHNPPYLHNDLNDGNVKIDFKNNEVLAVELIDFGASRQRGQPSTTFSMDYVMPEMNGVRNSKMPRTFAMDIYDFGHVAHSAFVRIKDVKSHPNAEGLRSIIIKCLSTDPMLRPTIAELEEQINQLMPKMPVEPVAEPSRPEAAQAVALKPEESSTHQDDSACLSEESSSVKNTGNNRRKVGCCAIL
jgi:serine/threonine protein kinase